MATSTGRYTKNLTSLVNFLDKREIMAAYVDITRQNMSFLDVMRLQGRMKPTKAVTYHHFTNSEIYSVESILTATDNTGASGQGDVTITFSAATSFREGDLILFNRSLNVGYVYDVNSTTSIDIKAVDSAVTTALLLGTTAGGAVGDKLTSAGNAGGEGSNQRQTLRYEPTKHFNQIMQMRDDMQWTDISLSTDTEVIAAGSNRYISKAEIDFLARWQGDISLTLLTSQISSTNFELATGSVDIVDPDNFPVQTTKGLNQYVAESGVLDTSVSVGVAAYTKLCRELTRARASGYDYQVFGGFDFHNANDIMFHNLNDSVIEPFSEYGRINLDGQTIDIATKAFSFGGFRFEFYRLPILDDPALFNYSGNAGFNKYAYFLPMGNVPTVGGGSEPRFCVRYLDTPKANMGFYQWQSGGLADTPTSGQLVKNWHYAAWLGFELLDAGKTARWTLA